MELANRALRSDDENFWHLIKRALDLSESNYPSGDGCANITPKFSASLFAACPGGAGRI